MTAQWQQECTDCTAVDINLNVNGVQNFDYTGKIIQATIKKAGRYKLEVWGAQGGDVNGSTGGYGGYAIGTVTLGLEQIYIVVGQKVSKAYGTAFNGGGEAKYLKQQSTNDAAPGGGATDVRVLGKTLYNRIIVAGGGGAGNSYSNKYQGGSGGGYIGGHPAGSDSNNFWFGGGTQTSGGYCYENNGTQKSDSTCTSGTTSGKVTKGTFGAGGVGQGTSSSGWPSAGGGGGWYGGGGGAAASGSGGSGFIYNSASESSYPSGKQVTSAYYLQNAQMYQYGNSSTSNPYKTCTSSTATATKTTCTTNYSSSATANYAKQGNGYARITYLGT